LLQILHGSRVDLWRRIPTSIRQYRLPFALAPHYREAGRCRETEGDEMNLHTGLV